VRFSHLTPLPTQPADAILSRLHPPVAAWWRERFSDLTAPQQLAVPAIQDGQHTLICAPTGSGKTLCAFISLLSDLLERHDAGALGDAVQCVYISPLKALGSDVNRNLLRPLEEIAARMCPNEPSPIRVAMRTGDTTSAERQRMARRPPHILITTPESLALCLATRSMRDHLRQVRTIIVDELHSVAGNKRGVDLALSVERLADLVMRSGGEDPQRIGLSATIAPLERMAEFLVGSELFGRPCAIADASFDRPLELEIASVFGKTPFSTTATITRHIYDTLERIIRAHRTTLVFTNLRSATERLTYLLRKRFQQAIDAGTMDEHPILPEQIEAHHSSLDRDLRLDIERKLKAGELRCVVCSTSLELGIDIGTIDRVVLLNSPKGVGRGLQRVGRSGHSHGGTARGTFIPTVPGDLLESLVIADAMRKRKVDAIVVPRNCLDVLAQHLIGLTLQAEPHGISTEDAYALVIRTFPFANLTREAFDRTVQFIATQELRETANVTAKLWLEPFEMDDATESTETTHASYANQRVILRGRLYPLRKAVLALYAQNVGTITSEGQVKVKWERGGAAGKGSQIGSVDEGFAQILKYGDRFVLAGKCVRFVRSEGMTLLVTESQGQSPTVPRWFGGMLSMEPGLAATIREFRAKVRAIAPAGPEGIARMLTRQYLVGADAARVAAEYLHAQFRYADIPVDGHLLVERVPDDAATVLVFHSMIGRSANEALARLVAYRMHKRFGSGGAEGKDSVGGATVVVDDYAFGIWVNQNSAARRADRTLIRSLLTPENFRTDLLAAMETSELFRTQFRFTAIRAHAILQRKFGRKRFIGQMQSYATKLYEALQTHHPDHLLLTETRRTVMEDVLSAPAALEFLHRQSDQSLRLLDLPSPSPFAFGLFAWGHRDTLQLADTNDFLLAMYQKVQQRLARQSPAEPATLF